MPSPPDERDTRVLRADDPDAGSSTPDGDPPTEELPAARAPATQEQRPTPGPSDAPGRAAPAGDRTRPPERPRPEAPATYSSTLVIEDGVIPRRLRRPVDALRLLLAAALIAGITVLAYFAQSTTSGIDDDLASASRDLPSWLQIGLDLAGGLGLIGLPVAAAVDLILRGRARQLLDAFIGAVAAFALLLGGGWLIEAFANEKLLLALSGSGEPGRAQPFSLVLGALAAFITVARLMGRSRWGVLSATVIASLFLVDVITGGITVAGITLSLLIGWGVGLLVRFILGTPTTRPSGIEVAAAMERCGYPLSVLRAAETTDNGRRYLATTAGGTLLEVIVLDRDLEGAGIATAVWRSLRLRETSNTNNFNLRRTLDHNALLSYAAELAGAPVPRLLASSEVGADSAVLVYERIQGDRFSRLAEVTDDDLDGAFRAMRLLHENRIAHGTLVAEHLLRDSNGHVWLLDPAHGDIAAGDILRRLDVAELVVTLALLTTPERAVNSGRRALGTDQMVRALAVMQPVALTSETRRLIRKRKKVLVEIRDQLTELAPEGGIEPAKLERLKPRTIIMIIALLVALYVFIPQITSINLAELIANVSWPWAILALLCSLITYAGATMSLEGFVPERLNFWRTTQAQVAGDFATLVAPPTVGALAINLRYLQKVGVHPALAAASVGVSQVAAFAVHIILLTTVALLAGTNADITAEIPTWAPWALGALVLVVAILLLLPPVRRPLLKRAKPIFTQVLPRLLTVAQQPTKLATGIGGILLLNAAYCACLIACVHAFGGDVGIWAICFVYLAGATVGQAAPTPGGIGAVEAVLTGALIAAGLDSGIALTSVLLFRVVTFWLPTIPGYFALNHMQRTGLL